MSRRLIEKAALLPYLENVSDGILAIDLLLHDTILIHTNRGENIQDSLVHGFQTINDERHSDLLPPRDTFLRGPTPVL